MGKFNILAFIVLSLVSLVPDLLALFHQYGLKNHVFPYEVAGYLKMLYKIPWTGFVFAVCFAPVAKLVFPNSTKIKFDEMAGFILILPLVQLIVPTVLPLTGPVLKAVGIPVSVAVQFVYAVLIATIARGVLGLEALGLISTLIVGFVSGLTIASVYLLPGLPFYPSFLPYFFIGGTMAFICARKMH